MSQKWSDLDDLRLSEMIAAGARYADVAAVLGRSVAAVRLRASRTGLSDKAPKPWTDEDDALVVQRYRERVHVAAVALELGRSHGSITTRACELGVARTWGTRVMPPSKFSEQGCPACGNAFVPTADTQVGCSQSCAQRHRIATQGHNRGMLGKTHSDETKKTIGQKSKARWDAGIPEDEMERRRQNGILQGSKSSTDNTHSRSVKGKRPDLGNQFFRSKWEANYARWLNYQMEHGGDVQSWEFEPRRFDFPIKRGTNSYLPDFRVVRKDGSVEWHEVKGWMTQKGATALKRFAKYFPDETLVLIDGPVYKSIASTASSLIENWE